MTRKRDAAPGMSDSYLRLLQAWVDTMFVSYSQKPPKMIR